MPSEVRLIPRVGDGYAWIVPPRKNNQGGTDRLELDKPTVERLKNCFTKQLSKHSVGAFSELCRGINTYFEAVAEVDILDLPNGTMVVQEKAQASSIRRQVSTNR